MRSCRNILAYSITGKGFESKGAILILYSDIILHTVMKELVDRNKPSAITHFDFG